MINNVKELLKERLKEMEGSLIYGCDMSFELLSEENGNGSVDCNKNNAVEWIKSNFSELSGVVESIEFNYGKEFVYNPFLEPEKFQVICYLEIASILLCQCELIKDMWNKKIELNDENISIICNQLDDVKILY